MLNSWFAKKTGRKSNSHSHNEVRKHQGIEAMAQLIGNERVDIKCQLHWALPSFW